MGFLSFFWHLFLVLGIFLLTLLGRMILFVCALIYTIARPRRSSEENEVPPFQTMYPEDNFENNFEDNLAMMSRVSLESVNTLDESST